MRTRTVECETLDQAKDLCPWACIFAEVSGGYKCFESIEDHNIWITQK
jgi:hypothetical protein